MPASGPVTRPRYVPGVTKPYGGSADGLNARQRRRRRIDKGTDYHKLKPLLVQMQKSLCGLCSRKLPEEMGRVEVDHIVRVRDGGTSTIDNLQAVHRSCNQRKGFYVCQVLILGCWRRR